MQDEFWTFHLFAATFASEAQAREYAFEQWAPEPSASATDAEYSDWEARNPTWRLKEELGFYMDSAFVELVDDAGYVKSQIRSESGQQAFSARAVCFSHFILVGVNAIWGDKRAGSDSTPLRLPESTATVEYLGVYNQIASAQRR